MIWTLYVRDLHAFEHALDPPRQGDKPEPLIPAMTKLKDWNWVIGFGLIFVGLALSAHPKTPLGRGQGVIVGHARLLPDRADLDLHVLRLRRQDRRATRTRSGCWADLGQLNLLVGIGFMAVGFTFATRWE